MGSQRDNLEDMVGRVEGVDYIEARYQSKTARQYLMSSDELEEATIRENTGIAVRILVNGSWGFSSTFDTTMEGMRNAMERARKVANASPTRSAKNGPYLGDADFAVGDFRPRIYDPVSNHSEEEKIELIRQAGKSACEVDPRIKSTRTYYMETEDTRTIVNSDGASCTVYTTKPEFGVVTIASEGASLVTTHEGVGITGGWKDLFSRMDSLEIAETSAERAVQLLTSRRPRGEKATVILDPGMVGLLSHEAVGHTVEGDFVLSGSITSGKIGSKIASDLVSMSDSGNVSANPLPAGTILVDDEGVISSETEIIRNGVLVSYLHNRETAAGMGVRSTGNARASEYTDEPIVRMRNTYVKPGNYDLNEMIGEVKHGYLLGGPLNGQADANGEFMFGAGECKRIENGEIVETMKEASISGRIFDALLSVDAVSRDFAFGIGAGYCGKGQMAKVDGGGPYVRLTSYVAGVRNGSA